MHSSPTASSAESHEPLPRVRTEPNIAKIFKRAVAAALPTMSTRLPLQDSNALQSSRALQHSKARGAELAKQAATARLEEEDAERAKREAVLELMERRKSYGRVTAIKRGNSPSPRRPVAGFQPAGCPSLRAGSSSNSASSSTLSSARSNLSADETRPASPLP